MGDDRAGTRAPGPAPAAEKKGAAPDDGGGGATPEGAAPSALSQLRDQSTPILSAMHSAAGNAAVTGELSALNAGIALAAKSKAEKDAFESMTEGQKITKYGDKVKGAKGGGGGGAAPGADAKGHAPPGQPDPAATTNYHANRAAALGALAGHHQSVATTLGAAAGNAELGPQVVAFLQGAAADNASQAGALQGLAGAYVGASAQLAGSEFIGAATPDPSVGDLYKGFLDELQNVAGTVSGLVAQFEGAFAAEEAKSTECDANVVKLGAELVKAQEAVKNAAAGGGGGGPGGGGGGGAGPDAKGAASGAEQKLGSVPPGQEAKSAKDAKDAKTPAPGAKGKDSKLSLGGGGGSGAPSSSGSTGNTGLPSPSSSGAEATAPEPGGAPAPGAADGAGGGGGGADAAAAAKIAAETIVNLQKQIDSEKKKKESIQAEIAAHTAFRDMLALYKGQADNLVQTYSGAPTPPGKSG